MIDAATGDVHDCYNQDWQMLEERFVDGEGATVASNEYVWSPDYVDSPIVRFHDGNGDGDYEDAGDNVRYYTHDANHNVTAVIDAATGAVVERYVYNAYGKATAYENDWDVIGAPTQGGPLYCGYFFDSETNLYQVRNRYYDPSLSTFISRDPIGYDSGDVNLYRYISNSPLIYTDPFGKAIGCVGISGFLAWILGVSASASVCRDSCGTIAVVVCGGVGGGFGYSIGIGGGGGAGQLVGGYSGGQTVVQGGGVLTGGAVIQGGEVVGGAVGLGPGIGTATTGGGCYSIVLKQGNQCPLPPPPPPPRKCRKR